MRMNKSGDLYISNVVQLDYFFLLTKLFAGFYFVNHLKWVAVFFIINCRFY
jgi:hypothetical protein